MLSAGWISCLYENTMRLYTWPCYPPTIFMTWIKTIPLSEANQNCSMRCRISGLSNRKDYADPVFHSDNEVAGIVGSHSLIPNALFHAFRPSAPSCHRTFRSAAASEDHVRLRKVGFDDCGILQITLIAA